MSKDYTNRELDMRFVSLTDKMNENHQETLDKIDFIERKHSEKHIEIVSELTEIQKKQDFTNGKVRRSEKWQYAMIMAGSASLFLIGVIAGLIVYIYQYQLSIQTSRINSIIQQK